MNDSKSIFLKNEVWSLSIAGAFQRSHIYSKEAKDKPKEAFKTDLRSFVDKIVRAYKSEEVKPDIHLENINSIVQFFKNYEFINNEQDRFGIAQKVLNLYLKYLWVLGLIKTPPHFPVDRQIQYLLGIKETDIISWTTIADVKQYIEIIALAEEKLRPNDESLAELELRLFNEYQSKR